MSTERDRDERLERALSAWETASAPDGFADRVVQAAARERAEAPAAGAPPPPRPARRRAIWLGAAAAGVVAALAAVWIGILGRPDARSGAIVARTRTSVELDGRGVAVVEPGASVSWTVKGGAAMVVQSAGDVFYRVEPGGTFVVKTPAGEVHVKGTCFRVEVMEMRPSKSGLIGAGVGAALSAAVVITVYEGKVLLANESGRKTLVAGQRGSLEDGTSPKVTGSEDGPRVVVRGGAGAPEEIPPPQAGATREELLERDRVQREELAKARFRIHELEELIAQKMRGGDARDDDDGGWIDPSLEELREMAKTCNVQFDSPPLSIDEDMTPRLAERMGIPEAQRDAVVAAYRDFVNRVGDQLRALYVEVTGDLAGAESLAVATLLREIEEKSPREDVEEATWRLSQERAQLIAPPADLASRPPYERALRIMLTIGDDFEKELAKVLGPEKARELREMNNGWGSKHRMNGCPENRPPITQPAQ
jgi:hypothetical protein